MRVLITGASGMLGKDFVGFFSGRESDEIYACQADHPEIVKGEKINSLTFDLTDSALFSRYLKEIRPELIIHCAAIVDVDICEVKRDLAMNLHSGTVRQIAADSPEAKLVYISTDSVFDGEKGDYSESDQPNPLNYYAETKLAGEQSTLRMVQDSIVIRTNIYGFHIQQGKRSLAEWALENLENGKQIGGFSDVLFNPVYTKQLAETVVRLTETGFSGLINIGSSAYFSKYTFLKELAMAFGFDPDLVGMKSINSIPFSAKRPLNTTLNTGFLERTLGTIPGFFEGMKQFHSDYMNFKQSGQ